jgi:protein arginine N-methyltransferase 3
MVVLRLRHLTQLQDIFLGDIAVRRLEFVSDFSLKAIVDKRTKVNSFVLYFDTFFAPSGRPIPPETGVKFIQEGDAVLVDIWPVGGKPATKRRQSLGPDREEITSFSTGPQSKPTHWKQTLFMLPEPITVTEGVHFRFFALNINHRCHLFPLDSTVTGSFHLKKRETNSRELDVEIHYSVKLNDEAAPTQTMVQMYRVQ